MNMITAYPQQSEVFLPQVTTLPNMNTFTTYQNGTSTNTHAVIAVTGAGPTPFQQVTAVANPSYTTFCTADQLGLPVGTRLAAVPAQVGPTLSVAQVGQPANFAIARVGHQQTPQGQAQHQQLSSSLYIKNLHPDADKLFLYERFAPYGAILSVKILYDTQTGLCRGVGFVNYSDNQAALKAIQALHGTKVGDKLLHVSLQTPRLRA